MAITTCFLFVDIVLLKIPKIIKHCYSIHCGPGGSSGKALSCGLDGPDSIPDVGGVEIFLHSFVWPGVHSTSYKMSTGEFPRG